MNSSENEVKEVQGPITKGLLNFLKGLNLFIDTSSTFNFHRMGELGFEQNM